jgi:hypothetical protein
MPESAKWLLSVGRVEEAEAIVRVIAKENKRPLPDGTNLGANVVIAIFEIVFLENQCGTKN